MKHFFRVTLILLFFSACSTNNEDDCYPPPEYFKFNLKNASTGEYLNVTDFDIDVHNSSGEPVEISYISLLNYVAVTLGDQAKSDTYTVNVGDEVEFDVIFTLEKINREPCPSIIANHLEIEGVNYEQDGSSDKITIFINEEEI